MVESNGAALRLPRASLTNASRYRARANYVLGLSHGLKSRLASTLPGLFALAGVAASTWVAFRVGQSFAFIGFVHLILVVLAAVYGGFWQATFVSVAAATCLNYFFVPPIFSFVNSPANPLRERFSTTV